MTRRRRILIVAGLLSLGLSVDHARVAWANRERRLDTLAFDLDAIARYQEELARELVERQDELTRRLVERQDELARQVARAIAARRSLEA